MNPPDSLVWFLAVGLPLLVAVALPGMAPTGRSKRLLSLAQLTGLLLLVIGLAGAFLSFPFLLAGAACAIASGVLLIASLFTISLGCPPMPAAAATEVLIAPGLALLLFGSARRWVLFHRERRHRRRSLPEGGPEPRGKDG